MAPWNRDYGKVRKSENHSAFNKHMSKPTHSKANLTQNLFLFLGICIGSLPISARTTLTPSQPFGNADEVVDVEVYLSSDDAEVVGAQFTLQYDPSMMTIGDVSLGNASSNHEIFDEQSDGKISITVLSMTNAAFSNGTLSNISFTLERDVPEDASPLTLLETETLLVTKEGESESFEAIQKINELFLQYAAQGDASKPSTARAVEFSGISDGTDSTYLWDFGDGTTKTGANVSHVYDLPNSYLITMTASNFLGTKTSVKRVSVSAPYWSIDSTDLGLGWKSFEWFGSFYPNEGNNWLFHEDLGWL